MKILWVSRHRPLEVQIHKLKEMFGDIQLVRYGKPFHSAEEIHKHFTEYKYQEMVMVAPLSVIRRMCELGVKPLWAEMRHGKFIRFKRINKIRINYTKL